MATDEEGSRWICSKVSNLSKGQDRTPTTVGTATTTKCTIVEMRLHVDGFRHQTSLNQNRKECYLGSCGLVDQVSCIYPHERNMDYGSNGLRLYTLCSETLWSAIQYCFYHGWSITLKLLAKVTSVV